MNVFLVYNEADELFAVHATRDGAQALIDSRNGPYAEPPYYPWYWQEVEVEQ